MNEITKLQIRPRKVRRVALVAAIALVLIFAVVAILLRSTPTGVYFQAADQVAMMLIGVLAAAGVLLFTRPRVTADARGIEVRNLVGARWFPWQVVTAISFPDGASWARLELHDDEYVAMMAIQATDGKRAVTAIQNLREIYDHFG